MGKNLDDRPGYASTFEEAFALQNILQSGMPLEAMAREFAKLENINLNWGTGMDIFKYYIVHLERFKAYPMEEMLKMFAELDVDFNARVDTGESALHFAISKNEPAPILALVRLGIPVNAVNKDGLTPLLRAVLDFRGEVEKLEIIRLLSSLGADRELQTVNGISAQSAVFRRHNTVVVTGLRAEADLQPHLNW